MLEDVLNQQDVKEYLSAHPEFFEANAAFLAEIKLPSPHGKGAISLTERQQLAQRDKIRVLESKLAELMINAQDNDAISEKIHHFAVQLQKASEIGEVSQTLTDFLCQNFQLANHQLKIIAKPKLKQNAKLSLFAQMDDAQLQWVTNLNQPYCGELPTVDIGHWFVTSPASIAIVPLKAEQTYGVLVIGSEDAARFYAGMGTLFLTRLGDLLSAAVQRTLVLA